MVHFGSLVESSDKFKHIDVMTKVLDMALFHFRCERNIQLGCLYSLKSCFDHNK